MQTASAFGQVQESLSWFVSAYVQLAEWKATVDRLTSFHSAAERAGALVREHGGIVEEKDGSALVARGLEIELPDGKPLLAPFDAAVRPGETVLVSGPSGSGKSTLFRVFAGIWPFGRGTLAKPEKRMLFLPQKPYLTIGTLREQLSYPAAPETFDDNALRAALADCGLPQLAGRLEEHQHWAQVLSPGEQQRIAFARALLHRPDWLFLDEATASLDESSEAHLYGLLKTRLPGTTVISIGHRPTLAQFHQRRWRIERNGELGVLAPA